MRHRVKGRKLNRNVNQRRALFKGLTTELIKHGKIVTTEAKAKAIKGVTDKLITKAKKASIHQRRLLAKFLNHRSLVNHLVNKIAPATGKRTSGFTRIVKVGARKGDNTMMVRVEFVDAVPAMKPVVEVKDETKTEKKSASKKATSTKSTGAKNPTTKTSPVKETKKVAPKLAKAKAAPKQRTTNK